MSRATARVQSLVRSLLLIFNLEFLLASEFFSHGFFSLVVTRESLVVTPAMQVVLKKEGDF